MKPIKCRAIGPNWPASVRGKTITVFTGVADITCETGETLNSLYIGGQGFETESVSAEGQASIQSLLGPGVAALTVEFHK